MSLPLYLQPSELIKDASVRFNTDYPLEILDIGSHTGRNSVYLASLGHNVVGLTDLEDDINESWNLAERCNVENKCNFVQGDMRELTLQGPFDVILMNEVLHLVTPNQADNVIEIAKSITKQGGLHIVSGYVVDPHQANRKNREHMFWPNQLRQKYDGTDWDILAYAEDSHSGRTYGNKQLIDSLARVVAQKSW